MIKSGKKLFLKVGFVLAIYIFAVAVFHPGQTKATSIGYNPANLISNSVFNNNNSMSTKQIQKFLEKMDSRLASYSHQANCTGAEEYMKKFYSCGESMSAASIIKAAGSAYSINPQVILATLQKEQSLITTRNPTSSQLKFAMGYGCPDSTGCTSNSFPGFFAQVDWATWQLRYNIEAMNGRTYLGQAPSYACNSSTHYYSAALKPGNRVTFIDDGGVRYRTLTIANSSTASLYCYTPHTYNNPSGISGNPKWGTKGSYYSGSYNFVQSFKRWFGSTVSHSSFVKCDGGNYYLIEKDMYRKRLLTSQAINAWNIDVADITNGGSSACAYPTYSLPLERVVISRKTSNMYVVDQGKSYRINSQRTATAWGLGNINNTSVYPNLDSKTITENVPTTVALPRLAKSPNTSKTYLVDNGKRYEIAGSGTSDSSSLQLVRGYNEVPSSVLSVPLIQTLTDAADINYSFQIGNSWYLLNHDETLRVSDSTKSIWGKFLAGPSLTSNVLSMFDENNTINNYFERDGAYYRLMGNALLERTKSPTVARAWVLAQYPTITRLLTNKLLSQLDVKDIKTPGDSTRLISCGDDKYLIERYIRVKRKLTPAAIINWRFSNTFYNKDEVRGCSYPTYEAILDTVIRSRNTGREYMVKDGVAYLIDSQASASAWGLGDYRSKVYPKLNGSSVHDNLIVKYSLPRPPTG